MNLNRNHAVLNRIAIIAMLASAVMLALLILISLGTRHVLNPTPGEFSISQVSWREFLSLFPLLAPFLFIYAAAIAFSLLRGRYPRIIAAAFGLSAAFLPAILFMIHPLAGPLMLLQAFPTLLNMTSAAITGAAHSREWWQENVFIAFLGLQGLWLLLWIIILVMECFRRPVPFQSSTQMELKAP